MKNDRMGMGRRALSLGMSAVLAVSMAPLPAFAAAGDGGAGTGAAGGDGAPAYRASTEAEYVPGEVLVEYDDASASRLGGLSLEAMSSNLSTMAGLEVSALVADRDDTGGTVVKAEVKDGSDPVDAARRAEELPGVKSAQPNYVYRLMEGAGSGGAVTAALTGVLAAGALADDSDAATNDPSLSLEWHLESWEDGHGADVLNAWKNVKANEETADSTDLGTVTVAILDTGIRADHEDLNAHIWKEYAYDAAYPEKGVGLDNFCDANNPTGDIIGHGTHVAGISAGIANNGVGIAGASYNANILPIKVFNDSSYNAYAQTEWLIRGYNYLMSDSGHDGKSIAEYTNTHVVNMSLGGYGQDENDTIFEERIEKARDEYNIITVCAGGNGDDYGNPITQPTSPGDYDACVSVTCLTSAGTNTYWSDYNMYKDVSAPGVDIYATYNESSHSYTRMTGTSMASPLVAGICALLYAADPDMTVEKAKDALYTTCQELDPTGSNYRGPELTGSHGAVDAAAAVEKVLEGSELDRRIKMATCTVEPVGAQLFTGEAVEPALSARHVDPETGEVRTLEQGVDFRVDFKNNVNVGQASATVIGIGDFIGRVELGFDIKYDFTQATVMVDRESYEATGAALEPAVHVALGGRLLKLGRDYTVAYSDNEEVGTARATVTGAGDYLGERVETFEIAEPAAKPAPAASKRDLSKVGVAAVADQAYKKGKAAKPAPKLTDSKGKALAAGIDYTLSWSGNAKAGFGRVFAKAKGGTWTGQTDAYFRILSGVPSFSDVKKSTAYASDIKMAVRLGLMTGKSGKFDVKGTFTRAQAATALYNLAGKPKASKTTKMTDVKTTAASYKALQWACANGMLATSGDKVKPDAAITQQDFANMLYRFGLVIGYGDMTVGVSKFFSAADCAKVSAADRVGVAWAAEKGVLALKTSKGKKLLSPTAAVTRPVAAHMLVAACDAIYQPNKARKATDDVVADESLAGHVVARLYSASAFALESGVFPEGADKCVDAVAGAEGGSPAQDAAAGEDLDAAAATAEADVLAATARVFGQADPAGTSQYSCVPKDFTYEKVDGGLVVTGYKGGAVRVEVPASVSASDRVAVDGTYESGAVVGIADGAFKGMGSLRGVRVPASVKTVGGQAFRECRNLVEVELAEGVVALGDEAFYDCSLLASIALPASLRAVGARAFANKKLSSVEVADGSEAFKSVDGVLFSADGKTLVSYPMGRAGAYAVPAGTEEIGRAAFMGIASASVYPLTSVALPDSVTAIGADAFREASGIISMQIPDSVTEIGPYAFASMGRLRALSLPDAMESIPEGLVYKCKSLTLRIYADHGGVTSDFVLPSGVKTIGKNALRGTNITSINLPEGLVSIGEGAFADCKGMAGLSFPSTLEEIGADAFSGCAGITKAELSGTKVTAVGAGAFAGCTGIAKLEVPSNVTSLGAGCFWGCEGLRELTFAEPCGLTAIPERAFTNAPLSSVVIPAEVASVGANAFSNNPKLETATFLNQGEWSMAPSAFIKAEPTVVYGYCGSSTWGHFPADALKAIDIENDLPLAVSYKVLLGGTVKLRSMVVSECGFVSLQWRKDGGDVAGANAGVLEVAPDALGETEFELVATNSIDPTHPVSFKTTVRCVDSLQDDIAGAEVAAVPDAAYTGKAVKPAVTATFGGAALMEGVDYTLSYAGNVKAGTASVTLAGKGEFKGKKVVKFKIVAAGGSFADVKAGAWYAAPVKEAAARGYMAGLTETAFGPTKAATRAQVAQALYRVANPGSAPSDDEAMRWAVSKKVFAKTGSAAASVSHQDLAVMLLTFAKAQGLGTSASAATFLGLGDCMSVAASARAAAVFTSDRGILGAAGDGKSKKFQPKGATTRAELARAVVALADLA